MSKLSNTLLMLSYLQNGRKYSINELAEKLEVSPRMVRTYKYELEKSGFFIDTIHGPYGGYVLKNNNINISASFNEHDLSMLKNLTLKKLDNESKEYLVSLIDKVKAITNSYETSVTDDIQNTYNILSKAIKEKLKVEISYDSYQKGINKRIIQPLNLFYLSNGFGVAAFCETKKDFRHFELKRILDIKLLNQHY